jgi:chitinase
LIFYVLKQNPNFNIFSMKKTALILLCAGFLFFGLTAKTAEASTNQWSMGYWCPIFGSPVLPIASIQWNGLTHIIQAFALPNADGTLDLTTWQVSSHAAALVTAAHANNVKALLSLQGSANFRSAVENHLATFVTNIMAVVTTYGYDGVDLDWEPFDPATSDAADMTALAAALRTALGNKLLTTTASTWPYPWAYFASNYSYFDRNRHSNYQCGIWHPHHRESLPRFNRSRSPRSAAVPN